MITQTLVLQSLQRLFTNCDSPSTLKYVLDHISFWKIDPGMRQNVLDSLDNVFAFSYTDEQCVQNLQYLIPLLAGEFGLETIFRAIEPGYVFSSIVRAACITDSDQTDGYFIDKNLNKRATAILDVLLHAFSDVGTEKERIDFQNCLVEAMKDAAMFGNIIQFTKIAEFIGPNLSVDECYNHCFRLSSCKERQQWINENWIS